MSEIHACNVNENRRKLLLFVAFAAAIFLNGRVFIALLELTVILDATAVNESGAETALFVVIAVARCARINLTSVHESGLQVFHVLA